MARRSLSGQVGAERSDEGRHRFAMTVSAQHFVSLLSAPVRSRPSSPPAAELPLRGSHKGGEPFLADETTVFALLFKNLVPLSIPD